MKHAKMLGLGVVAALAIMAVMGAGSASAKVCSNQGTGVACAAGHGNVFGETGKSQIYHATGKALLVSGFITLTCSSTIEGKITNGGASPAIGNVETLTFSECTAKGFTNCTASTTATHAAPWAAQGITGTAPNGFLEVTAPTGTINCLLEGSPIKCIYNSATVGNKNEIAITGGTTASVKATNVPLAKEAGSNPLCSATATWSSDEGSYVVDTPDSLFLT